MADSDLPASGKDTRWTITVDSVPLALAEIVSVEVTPTYDEIMTKPLGAEGARIDTELSHYEITVEIKVATTAADQMIDDLDAARVGRTAKNIVVTGASNYRNGTSRTYSYRDAKLTGYRVSARRGEGVTYRLTFKSGNLRTSS